MGSVPHVLDQAKHLFKGKQGTITVVDLAEVRRIDSAGLALLIEWSRQAQRRGVSIHFENIPSQMWAIVTVYGLEEVLPASAFRA
jgi:phospholipid transport system transporter-binding protein